MAETRLKLLRLMVDGHLKEAFLALCKRHGVSPREQIQRGMAYFVSVTADQPPVSRDPRGTKVGWSKPVMLDATRLDTFVTACETRDLVASEELERLMRRRLSEWEDDAYRQKLQSEAETRWAAMQEDA